MTEEEEDFNRCMIDMLAPAVGNIKAMGRGAPIIVCMVPGEANLCVVVADLVENEMSKVLKEALERWALLSQEDLEIH